MTVNLRLKCIQSSRSMSIKLAVKVVNCNDALQWKCQEFQEIKSYIAFKMSGAVILCPVLDILSAIETVPLFGSNYKQAEMRRDRMLVLVMSK